MSAPQRNGFDRALRSPLCRAAEVLATLARLPFLRDTTALPDDRDLGRRLTCCWLLALGLVALAAIAATTLTVGLALHQREYSALINDAASQRARSQRLAAFLPELLQDDPFEVEHVRLEVARIVERMEAVFAGLADGEDPPAREDERLEAHYFQGPYALAPRLARFLAGLRAVLRDLETGGSADAEAVGALRAEALGPLLGLLDEAVTLHEAHARAAVDRLVLASLVVGVLALALLAAIGIGVFKPMTASLAATVGRLSGLAHSDPLTGVANRRAIIESLSRAIAADRELAAVAIDLDHFKEANERVGHAGGDALLVAVAKRLTRVVRPYDIVGRLGGDEFVVFLLGVSEERVLQPIVERIRATLHEPVPFEGRVLPLGATLGIALCPHDARDPEVLLRVADEALLRAKRERRGSIGRARREDTLAVEIAHELRTALDASGPSEPMTGLAAFLQPIVPLDAGLHGTSVLGVEALARWTHPRLGPVPPDKLFGAVADRASAVRLGRRVRRLALAAFAAIRRDARFDLRLGLNLAPAEVLDESVVDRLLADLEEAGVTPAEITLEITEEVLLDRVSEANLARLAELRRHGTRLALDDFGTGSSGLAQLLRLPIDTIKIDRRFVAALGQDRRAAEIVRATVALAGALDMTVIAEGVETVEQVRTLTELGCQGGQGYLFARPMDAAALRDWLAQRCRPARAPGPPVPALSELAPAL